MPTSKIAFLLMLACLLTPLTVSAQTAIGAESTIEPKLEAQSTEGEEARSLAAPALKLGKPAPQAVLQQAISVDLNGDLMMRYIINVKNYLDYKSELFKEAPYLPPLAEHLNASRTWVYIKDQNGSPLQTFGAILDRKQLQELWFAVEKDSKPPEQVHVDIWDRQLDLHYKSDPIKVEIEKGNKGQTK